MEALTERVRLLEIIVAEHARARLVDFTDLANWMDQTGDAIDVNTGLARHEQRKVSKLMQAKLAEARKLKTSTVLNKFAKEGATKRAIASTNPLIPTRIAEFAARPRTRRRRRKSKKSKPSKKQKHRSRRYR